MVDQSNFFINPIKLDPHKTSEPGAVRVEPTRPDEQKKYKQVAAKRGDDSRDPDDASAVLGTEDEEMEDSIFALSKKLAKKKAAGQMDVAVHPDRSFVDEDKADLSYDALGNKKVDMSQETRPDLVQVNPQTQQSIAQVGPIGTKEQPQQVSTTDMYHVVQQLVDKLMTLKTAGVDETIMTLKYPPLFDGAIVKIIEHASAKGEFNISIENLNPQAKALTDMESSKLALQQGIEDKGFRLHILVTTTEVEVPKTEQANAFAGGKDEGKQEKEKQQGDEEA